MHIDKTNDITRRVMMRRALGLAMTGTALPLAMNLAAFGEAAAFDNSDYKALVCVFLYGGSDHNNTLIPYDLDNYDRYHAIRGGGPGRTAGHIAVARADLSATALTPLASQTLTDDLRYALNPQMTGLKSLFDAGKAAIQLNVGPLMTPLTLAQFNSPNRVLYPLPPKLFSHNDQQSVWQSLASEGSTIGWGGRIGDLAMSSNNRSILTCISAAGNAVFVSGDQALQYQISPNGAVAINPLQTGLYGSQAAGDALRTLITRTSSHVLEDEFTRVTRRSIEMEGIVNAALSPVSLNTAFPANNSLAAQMRIVARLIGARNTLGAKRQVFFVSLGGFDNHDLLMENHPALMRQVSDAMTAFYNATVELGVANKVTAFTASDFGRTLSSNGNGSDHGWGSHHFVVGGAVNGGRYFGTAPHISIISDDQVGQGRLLPSTSVDQMGATLARWFGVSNSELPTVLPNIGRFGSSNLGYFS
ncbi:DUF1501 domain-containing protein [Asticcacaulis tiandongensis]|uniref:DUF1501 domain-containing protein n=1 Tax=Asticcacaulis tiandongensis TaxID=2565365 RepID=UPI00112E11AF|nr:DUF1501 domain-containing protein [Asticcacaulis tiandongensis]